MTKSYMKPGLQWEDPLDGKGPDKHPSQKKGARQHQAKCEDCLRYRCICDDPDLHADNCMCPACGEQTF